MASLNIQRWWFNCCECNSVVHRVYVWCVVWCLLCTLVQKCSMAGVIVATAEENGKTIKSICEMNGCNCTQAFTYWKHVNCSFDHTRQIDLRPGILPTNVIELSIIGGKEVKFHPNLFSTLTNFQRLRTDSTQAVIFKKHTFLNVTANSLLVQLAVCNSLILETAAFKNMKGPVTAEVSRCGYVVIQRAVFSFLQDATFQEIRRLDLEEEAFTLPARELGHHGAVTTIRFRDVIMPALPKDVFKSSLAEVSLLGCEVREVSAGAFSGITIAAVTIMNTSLHRVRTGAFSDRTQLDNLFINDSQIHEFESDALLSATTNLTVQHSKIKKIHTGAINATIAKVTIYHNKIDEFHSKGFSIHDWNLIYIEHNLFLQLDKYSMEVPFKYSPYLDQYEFTFSNNQVQMVEPGALTFFSDIMPNMSNSRFENNQFRYTCHCDIEKWLEETLGTGCAMFSSNNYCTVDSIVARCYDIEEGLMRMKNYTDMFCENGSVIQCKVFDVDANVGVNKKYSGDPNNSNLILGLLIGLVFIIAVCGIIVILLIHGGLWLKRKGYCVRFKNFNYQTNEESTEAEDVMVTVDNMPEDLSQELLQALREKLEDPLTYNEAREMIERLYDHFIIEDSYTNNNRQEEETHLYEELGNLPPLTSADADKTIPNNRPFSFLRLIEERFNLTPTQEEAPPLNGRPSVLADEYSEPTDAEVHLYSELPQNGKEGKQNEINESLSNLSNNTQRSTGSNSNRMAYRPLPDKPKLTASSNDPGEGPSTKF